LGDQNGIEIVFNKCLLALCAHWSRRTFNVLSPNKQIVVEGTFVIVVSQCSIFMLLSSLNTNEAVVRFMYAGVNSRRLNHTGQDGQAACAHS